MGIGNKGYFCSILSFMKRVLATILAFVYLSTSTGATLHFHYCMGKLVSWGLQDHESKRCELCGMSKQQAPKDSFHKKNNCCKDEHAQMKTASDQKTTQTEWQFAKSVAEASTLQQLVPCMLVSSPAIRQPVANAPPLHDKVPVFLLHCHFRI